MKLLLHVSLLLFSISGFSQKAQKDVQVEYQVFYANDSPMKMDATLYISGNTSVYREKLSNKEPWVERSTPEIIARDKRFATGYVPEDYYMKVDRNKKEVLFYDYVIDTKFLVKKRSFWERFLYIEKIINYFFFPFAGAFAAFAAS